PPRKVKGFHYPANLKSLRPRPVKSKLAFIIFLHAHFSDGDAQGKAGAAATPGRAARRELIWSIVAPGLNIGVMRLLDRYLLRELLVPLAYCLGGFLIFYVSFDLIFGIKGFLDKHLSFGDIAEYYAVTLPELLVTVVIPVSLLLASLYSLTNHSRHQELTAMRAAGVSLGRLAAPYFAVGLLLGLAVLAMNELLVPPAADRAREILRRHDPNPQDRALIVKLDFHNEAEDRDWKIDRYNRDTTVMTGPHLIWGRPDGSVRIINADRAIYSNGQWVFFNVEDWVTRTNAPPPSGPKLQPILKLRLAETPAWIESELKVKALSPTEAARKPQLSIREILTYFRLHPHLEATRWATLMTQLQCRLAEPFTCLTVVLIALPFGARSGRHNVFAGVASGLFICFGFFIMQRIAMGLGVSGNLPPVLAAWLPNLVFGLAGLALIWRAR
ncbi:MAG TPA: LptF/LptG family permease, partial [Candidatus Acidoferrum sp.]|nr:LptF/LptG family permease [Candidatus Acidoferrum sp.]